MKKFERGSNTPRKDFLSAIGLNPDDVLVWADKWYMMKANAKGKGVVCRLTFEEYVGLAAEAGLNNPHQIGVHNESYHLSRIGDSGDYEIGNCRFLTHNENRIEKITNGGDKRGGLKKAGALSLWSKNYRLHSVDGEVVEGCCLSSFCKERNLNLNEMASICRGKRKTPHRGWLGEYV